MIGRSIRGSLIAIVALGALCVAPAAEGRSDGAAQAYAAEGGADDPAQAHATRKCHDVTTTKGGTVKNIFATGSCRRARRVARRAARGKRYRALGFSCSPKSPYRSFVGQLFGCTGTVAGKPQGIGFSYFKPGAATAARSCGSLTTRDGGTARFVNVVRARCAIARRVARRADGRRYSFLGFDCKWERKPGVRGKLYGCGRVKDGRGQGVGFVYRAA